MGIFDGDLTLADFGVDFVVAFACGFVMWLLAVLVLLIQDACGGRGKISQEDIKLVLRSTTRLEELYVRKPKGRGR